MRNAALVTGLAVGTLAVGAATAAADPVPITIDVTSGTVKPGSFAQGTTTGTGKFVGTIDSTTFAATFPAGGNSLPSVTIPDVTIKDFLGITTVYTGPLTVDAAPGAFTGRTIVNGNDISLDLNGPVTYTFKAGDTTCTGAATTAALTGAPIDFVTGAYSASGSAPAPTLSPVANRICSGLAAQLPSTVGTIATTIAGKLTIPGLIPLPAAPVATPPKTTTTPPATTTPTTSTPTSTVAKAGKLSVTVSRPATVKRGRSTVTKVVVRNTGTGSARNVTVKLSAASGVTPRSVKKTYATIGAGKVRTINVRLRTTKKTAKKTTVKVTATGTGGLSASKSTSLRLR
jgi:hypothetical protein